MPSTLAFQLAAFQLAAPQLAAFQLAAPQLAAFQLACAHDAFAFTYSFQLTASKVLAPVSASVFRKALKPSFGFGGLSIDAATPASISPTPAALAASFGREFAESIRA